MDAAASDPQPLTDVGCSVHDYSPDGSLIAFDAMSETEVFVVDAEGGAAEPVLPGDGMSSADFAWRPM